MFLFRADAADEHGIKSKWPLPALPEGEQLPTEPILHLCWKTPGLLIVVGFSLIFFKASLHSKPVTELKTSLYCFSPCDTNERAMKGMFLMGCF